MIFKDIVNNDNIYLYCGDLPISRRKYTNIPFIGLTLKHKSKFANKYYIQHDITKPIPLRDNTVDIVQSEDVMEHIEFKILKNSINEIYRILKPNGLFRLSMPDYKCDILYNRSVKDSSGNIIFDKKGGGS